MEVLATLSSLISLLEVSIKVIKTGLKYYSDFKSADNTLPYFSKCLVEELDSLKRLKTLCDVLKYDTCRVLEGAGENISGWTRWPSFVLH